MYLRTTNRYLKTVSHPHLLFQLHLNMRGAGIICRDEGSKKFFFIDRQSLPTREYLTIEFLTETIECGYKFPTDIGFY